MTKSVIKRSNITHINHYGKMTAKSTGMPEGSIWAVTFELDGQEFLWKFPV